MIQITRSLVREFRAVCKRLLCGKRRKINPTVQFEAGPEGLFIRSRTLDGALQYHVAGEFPAEQFAVPLTALTQCYGNSPTPVSFDATSSKNVTLTWEERRIPRQHSVSQAQWENDAFPATPSDFTSLPAELLTALEDASQTSDQEGIRYALDHLQLDGSQGRIVATDGKHLLIQTGFQFPWEDAVLIPASSVFESPELLHDQPVGIAKSENWLSFSIGNWLIHLPINKDGRFPKCDDIVPRPERIVSRLQIADADAQFLQDAIPRLPGGGESNHPITLDLNGEVVVRATASDQPQPTELVLSQSRLVGEPVRININREFLARTVCLGFREIGLIDADGILTCRDGRRTYLWMPLEAKSAVKPNAKAVRIESNNSARTPQLNTPLQSITNSKPTIPMTKPKINRPKPEVSTNSSTTNTTAATSSEPVKPIPASPMFAAIELRTTLRTALTDLNNLIASLRRNKRQQRIVATTLQSLKELQKVAG